VVDVLGFLREPSRVTGLAAALAALAPLALLALWRLLARCVRRGWLGRVLRVLAELSLQLDDLGTRRRQLLARRRQFLQRRRKQGYEFPVFRPLLDLTIKIFSRQKSRQGVNAYQFSCRHSWCSR